MLAAHWELLKPVLSGLHPDHFYLLGRRDVVGRRQLHSSGPRGLSYVGMVRPAGSEQSASLDL